ncbi:peptide methionine sulfoxide reductase [Penicillium canariense]|uniref:peptide-methionine (S)-S-oxide reductase n=1 Tax=Penicillium canariense TaxID=189055 RepID=A0A9W9LT96_9EURO|nr:peptide methionine sulfoxide reductase [Penicillium canariense]KAJ5174904.1 peptide methionine sulfoxide reductase [Penicillium canariense]
MSFAAPVASTLFSRFFRPFSASSPFLSLTHEPQARKMSSTTEQATLAAGCFWGVEHLFRKQFGNGNGLVNAKVGYSGGQTSSPSYRAVCSGDTGHAEALQISFDPSVVSYRQLIEFFYRMHDATTLNRQGPDVGTQYRSVIFTHGEEQQKIAEDITDKVSKEWFKQPVSTQVVPAGQWWDAEEYHQLYLNKNPTGYECPAQYVDPKCQFPFHTAFLPLFRLSLTARALLASYGPSLLFRSDSVPIFDGTA